MDTLRTALDIPPGLVVTRTTTVGDAEGLLQRLVARIVRVIGIDDACIIVVEPGMEPTLVAEPTPDEQTRIALLRSLDDGPGREAMVTGDTVLSGNLLVDRRWPGYRPIALRAGLEAIGAVPLETEEHRVGVLLLGRRSARPWGTHEIDELQFVAEPLAGYVLTLRELWAQRRLAEQLQTALDSRVVLEQAKGMLAERHAISVDAAFDRIRGDARAHNRVLHAVARDIVARRPTPGSPDVATVVGEVG
jgi:GAF domain-containing protein